MNIAELFSAGSPGWLRVSPKLHTYWHTLTAIAITILLATCAVVLRFTWQMDLVRSIFLGIAVVVILLGIWMWILIGRRVRSIGYRIEERELKVSSGILFRRVVSVPFARMQLVEVSAGPLERAFSIASVQLHTASASTDATIPGLDPQRAAELRDALTAHSSTAGL